MSGTNPSDIETMVGRLKNLDAQQIIHRMKQVEQCSPPAAPALAADLVVPGTPERPGRKRQLSAKAQQAASDAALASSVQTTTKKQCVQAPAAAAEGAHDAAAAPLPAHAAPSTDAAPHPEQPAAVTAGNVPTTAADSAPSDQPRLAAVESSLASCTVPAPLATCTACEVPTSAPPAPPAVAAASLPAAALAPPGSCVATGAVPSLFKPAHTPVSESEPRRTGASTALDGAENPMHSPGTRADAAQQAAVPAPAATLAADWMDEPEVPLAPVPGEAAAVAFHASPSLAGVRLDAAARRDDAAALGVPPVSSEPPAVPEPGADDPADAPAPYSVVGMAAHHLPVGLSEAMSNGPTAAAILLSQHMHMQNAQFPLGVTTAGGAHSLAAVGLPAPEVPPAELAAHLHDAAAARDAAADGDGDGDGAYSGKDDKDEGADGETATKYTGVRRNKGGRYSARIKLGGTNRYLGSFKTAEEAARAFDECAIQNGRPVETLNFPAAYGGPTVGQAYRKRKVHKLYPDPNNHINVLLQKLGDVDRSNPGILRLTMGTLGVPESRYLPDNKYAGIRQQAQHWETRIRYKDKLYSMGFFASVEAAALAWDITAASLRRCNKLNFPEVSFADLEQQLDALKSVISQANPAVAPVVPRHPDAPVDGVMGHVAAVTPVPAALAPVATVAPMAPVGPLGGMAPVPVLHVTQGADAEG